jgi:predicted NBD/HSP70 family sugar kinase
MSRHALEGRVGAVGIAIGGIVHEGYVTSRSGIAGRMSDGDFEQLRNLAATLQERLGAPALLTQDVIAKAHALRPRYTGRRVLVLDLGTSTGGAFIAADGAVPDYLNQVGRVVFDLSEDAIPRDDLKARGVLSKYLSLTGYARACRTLGLEDISTDSVARLAAANDPKGLRLLETLSRVLAEAVVVLNRYYDADTAVLTGGLMRGEFGSLLVGGAERSALEMGETLPELKVSTDPVFEGADGAARMAASRLFSRAAPSS